MKKSLPRIIAVLVVILMLSAVSIGGPPDIVDHSFTNDAINRPILSAEVWSDNFDDEDISDWDLFMFNYSVEPNTRHPGGSSAEGGVLRLLGDRWNFAGHNSSVAFGTWSFDIDIQDPRNEIHFYVHFICEVVDDDWLFRGTIGGCVSLGFYTHEYDPHEIWLLRSDFEDEGRLFLDTSYTNDSIIGWRNVIITRELSGQYYVYLDGTLILKGKDLLVATSERFYIMSKANPAIDNVSVSNTIDYDAAGPEWEPAIMNQQIIAGDPFYYDLNATDYSGIDQWWINDTQNFAIDVNGVISNIKVLDARPYGIEVSVNDTLGNTQTGTIRLTVESLPALFPMELAIAAVGVGGVVILVLVIWRTRK